VVKLELRPWSVSTPGARDAKRTWADRQSLLVRLVDPGGHTGLGEAAPLPGYGPDTLEDAERALRSVSLERLGAALDRGTALAALVSIAELVPATVPSARMALETAALDWLARRARVSAPALLGAAPTSMRPLSQLLGPASDPTLLERAVSAAREGYGNFKLKLGGGAELERELETVSALREQLGSTAQLRLDANGALREPELERAWPVLERSSIEVFEEPGAIPQALAPKLPLALDESLQGASLEAIESALRERRPRCLVLKPTALGGLAHCWQVAELARRHGVSCFVSHAFEGPIAWRSAAALALALPSGAAHGLAPHAGLAGWPTTDAPIVGGLLTAWSAPGLDLVLPGASG
jgi:o-succinylbenzoate synthase